MNDKDKKKFEKSLEVVCNKENDYERFAAIWQAALDYARSEGPEDSIHEKGGVSRNMTWKESSEMMDRMAESLGKELKEWKEIVRSKVQMLNEEKERSKILVEALEKISSNWSDDYRYDASKALRKYRGEE